MARQHFSETTPFPRINTHHRNANLILRAYYHAQDPAFRTMWKNKLDQLIQNFHNTKDD